MYNCEPATFFLERGTRHSDRLLEEPRGKHPQVCFTYRGAPIRWDVTNTAWHTAIKNAEIEDLRFHDLRHTWASWHRQAGTSCDELKDLGGWKSRSMVDRYAKFFYRKFNGRSINDRERAGRKCDPMSRFCHIQKSKRASA